jgi:hypothetical protein
VISYVMLNTPSQGMLKYILKTIEHMNLKCTPGIALAVTTQTTWCNNANHTINGSNGWRIHRPDK